MPAQKLSSPDSNGDTEQQQQGGGTSTVNQNGYNYNSEQSCLDSSQQHEEQKLEVVVEEEVKEEEDEEMEEEDDEEGEEDEDEDGETAAKSDDDDDEEQQKDESMEEQESEFSSSEEDEDDAGEKPEFVFVELSEVRKDVQCPICLGIIKKTRTVMECLHRFCRECIDKSMRLGNNECPACRTHCASRRSLRDDPNYDALIAALYPDIDKYEEEELAFHEEERARNKQIQASIAQIFQRQSEALTKKRAMAKETSFMTRSQRNHRTIPARRRRNSRGTEFQGSEDIEEENDDNIGKDSSSADERSTEGRQRRRKRRAGIRSSQPSSSASNPDGVSIENDTEGGRENRGISPGLAWSAEMLAWGRGGVRSNTRHGSGSGGNNKNFRSTRVSKLVEYLRSLEEKNDELDVHLMLFSLEKQSTLSLQQPYLCCRPSLSVKHLCEYVAHQTPLQAEEVEILLVKEANKLGNNLASISALSMEQFQILKEQETLAGLKANSTHSRDRLILAYRQKEAVN